MSLLDKACKDDSKQEQELHYLEKRPFVNVLSPHCQLIDGDNAFSYCESLINGMDTFECSL